MARLEIREELERVRIVAARARLPVEPGHGLEVVVHHVREGCIQRFERALDAPPEIRHEDLDFRTGRALAHRADAVDEVTRAAVFQVVAVHARNDDVGEAERGDRLREVLRLLGIWRERPSMGDVAERTAPRAQVPQDHEGRGAFSEALADVGAGGFLAYGVQIIFAQDALDVVKTRTGRGGAHADPLGLGEALGRRKGDRNARFGEALLFLDGCRHLSSMSRAMRRPSSSPIPCASASTPCARACVTARPGYPQGSIAENGARSISTLSATP